jgi:hypothetical protein
MIQVRHGGLVASILAMIPKRGAVLWLWQADFSFGLQCSSFLQQSLEPQRPVEKLDGAC